MHVSLGCSQGHLGGILAQGEAGKGSLAVGTGSGENFLDLRHILPDGDVRERWVGVGNVGLDCRSPARPGLNRGLAGNSLQQTKGGAEVIVYGWRFRRSLREFRADLLQGLVHLLAVGGIRGLGEEVVDVNVLGDEGGVHCGGGGSR